MKITRKVLFELPPVGNNTRNSEGDFCRLPNGDIMFAYTKYVGSTWDDHEDSMICAIYSHDGEHFDLDNQKIILYPSTVGASNVMSTSLVCNDDGTISLYCIAKYDTKDFAHKPVRDEYYRIDSKDGYDFSCKPILCFPKSHKGYYCINNNRVVTISTGRMFIPMSEHKTWYEDGKYHLSDHGVARFVYSDDKGKTWNEDVQRIEFPVKDDKNGLQEPGIIELPNGVLYGYYRTDADYQYESFSYDKGITWTEAKQSKFESPLSPMLISKNPYSGKYYAIHNPYRDDPTSVEHPRFRNTWGRTPLVIEESLDGINYGKMEFIEEDIHRGYCYPAIFFISEKEAIMSYCSGGGDIVPLQRTTVSKITIE